MPRSDCTPGVDYVVEDRGYKTPCWIWQGALNSEGYGHFTHRRRTLFAHRVMYERHKAPIPRGLDLDHLCRIRPCINPDHVEPVTRRVNLARGIRGIPKHLQENCCARGHEFTPENTVIHTQHGRRCCRMCKNASKRRRRAELRA